MAENPTVLKIRAEVENLQGLNRLKNAVRRVSQEVKASNVDFKKQIANIKELQVNTKNSVNNLRAQKDAFLALRDSVDLTSKEFKEATAEVAKLDAALAKAEGRKAGRGGRLAGIAKGVGAIAAGGVFGGPEGALGGAAGLALGGPAGAAVGAAIGAQVGQLRQALGATAEYAAGLQRLRIALKGVTTSQEEYQASLAFIQQTTKDFAIPQEVVTRQFTKLQASVQGAGGNLEDTKTAFNGIVAAVRATGGSLSDVDAALTATAQVFSKGKVSAEELRQQIGERLPGAFTLFAESMGLTPQELDKALEDGKVSLQDFQGFAEAIFERYGENAKAIADSPAAAGDRLKVALERLNESIGTLLKPIGEAFQNIFTDIVNAITSAANALQNFFDRLEARRRATEQLRGGKSRAQFGRSGGVGARGEEFDALTAQFLEEIVAERAAAGIDVQQPRVGTGLPGITPDGDAGKGATASKMKTISAELLKLTQERFAAVQDINKIKVAELDLQISLQKITEQFNAGEIDFNKAKELDLKAQEKFLKTGLKLREEEKRALANLSKANKENNKELTKTEKLFESIKSTVATGLANAIEGLIDGTKTLGESLSGILKQLGSMILQTGMQSLVSGIFANGAAFQNGRVTPFAYGGVVKKPTLFPMANGMGLMGEAGPEAIMPLRRGRGGRLGVEATGGTSNIVVNVDASGTQVQGDDNRGKQLGSAISAAVQAELIKQRRPGGLLAS